jgi:hypothetical protein
MAESDELTYLAGNAWQKRPWEPALKSNIIPSAMNFAS